MVDINKLIQAHSKAYNMANKTLQHWLTQAQEKSHHMALLQIKIQALLK